MQYFAHVLRSSAIEKPISNDKIFLKLKVVLSWVEAAWGGGGNDDEGAGKVGSSESDIPAGDDGAEARYDIKMPPTLWAWRLRLPEVEVWGSGGLILSFLKKEKY
jgi:hypothetical protein